MRQPLHLHPIPLLRVFIPFVAGIVLARMELCFLATVLLASAYLFLLILNQVFSFGWHNYVLIIVFQYLTLIWCGMIIYKYTESRERNYEELKEIVQEETEAIYQIDQYLKKSKYDQLLLHLLAYRDRDKNWVWIKPVKIILYLHQNYNSEDEFQSGQIISFSARINETRRNENQGLFNYSKYLNDNSIYYTVFSKSDNIRLLDSNVPWHKKISWSLRTILIKESKDIFSEINSALIQALLFGFRIDIDENTNKIFRNTGSIHVLAVSGLHTGIIAHMVLILFSFLFGRKYRSFQIILWCLLFLIYSQLTGAAPSVIRASVMIALFFIASRYGYKGNGINILLAAALGILFFYPKSFFLPGFQLSFLAVLGILFYYPYLQRIEIPGNFLIRRIWQMTCVSLASQAFIYPLTIYYFHQFPWTFAVSSILAVFFIYWIIIFSSVGLMFHWIFPSIGSCFIWMTDFSIGALLSSLEYISNIRGILSTNIWISKAQVFLLLASSFFIFLFLKYRSPLLLHIFMGCIVIVLSYDLRHKINCANQTKVYYYEGSFDFVEVYVGNKSYVITKIEEEVNTENISAVSNRLKHAISEIEYLSIGQLDREYR